MTQFVERDGVKLAYDTAGSGNPPIMFVHGWAGDRSYFEPQFEHFSTQHAVATVDLRGHGDSDRPEPAPGSYDVAAFTDDVLLMSRGAGFDKPVVVGHSLGGLIALACAGRRGAVRAAVMIDPAPIVSEDIKAFLAEAAGAVETDHDGSWRTAFVNGMFMSTDTIRREEIVRGMTQLPPRVAAATLRAIVNFDGVAALRAAEVPVLSVGSAAPTNTPDELRAACPTITIGQTVGSGHFNQLEVPDQVNLMIERFLTLNGLSADAPTADRR
jgi:pimeloyl-ACP methyl ester carboxylesterase